MALAFANVTTVVQLPGGGPQGTKVITANVTLDTSYPTGGSAGVAAGLGLGKVLALVPLKSLGYDYDYDVATDRLKVYQQPAAAAAGASPEAPNTTNLSANVLPVLVFGQ
jgi:hypothetical protein